MLKSFGWTLLFWSLFIVTNTIGDAVRFYDVFHWYGDLRLWHFLKIWWMLWLFLTGVFALRLWENVKYEIYHTGSFKFSSGCLEFEPRKKYRLKATLIFTFLLAWFFVFRLIAHNALMWIWRTS
jgi:hypothetical protein